jgi:hypothetical protein
VGRTGTMLAALNLAAATESEEEEAEIDVYRTVLDIREFRPLMVNTFPESALKTRQ